MVKVYLFLLCYACMPYWLFPSAFFFPNSCIRQSPKLLLRASSEVRRPTGKSSSLVLHATVSITLEKPLGLLLEEVEENTSNGVKVQALSESGSAYISRYKDQLVGCKILKVMGDDVAYLPFDDVMDKLVNAPSPIVIEVALPEDVDSESVMGGQESQVTNNVKNNVGSLSVFDIGTTVPITVIQEGKDTITFDAKVGDNLRMSLLQNNIDLYRGLKKKLGNCGGGGQCTFCAVDMVDSQGWEPRSDYENQKISKWPNARLACLNNIQGPCTIRIQ